MTPFECYTNFLSLKQHFTKPNYNAVRYNFKVRASLTSFHKRTDRYFYERLSRKKSEQEIKDFYISNFVAADNPNSVYIVDLMKDGEETYIQWLKRIQSLSYLFKSEVQNLLFEHNLNQILKCKNSQHSLLIRKYLQKIISIETLVILEKLLNFVGDYNKVLDDPIWNFLQLKITKYEVLLNIDNKRYFNILKEIICE